MDEMVAIMAYPYQILNLIIFSVLVTMVDGKDTNIIISAHNAHRENTGT
jgi:hypothetical protein